MTNGNDALNALLSALHSADSVLLFCHVSPDGDTLGSALALSLLLKERGVVSRIVLDGAVPENLAFLPDCSFICKPEQIKPSFNTLAIAVDVSSLERMGAGAALFAQAAMTAVIDHHGTNPCFGQINWIDADAPATATLIFQLYQTLGAEVSVQAAICLYTALATDTGNFLYQSMNADGFRMMATLMEAGLPLAKYGRMLFRQKRESFVRLLGATLPSLRLLCGGKVAGLRVSLESTRAAGADSEDMEGVVNYAIDLNGVGMAYFAHEKEPGATKVSFRALSPYRIDQVAASFGGGGHRLAAGCTLSLPLEQAAEQAEQALTRAWAAQNGTDEQ